MRSTRKPSHGEALSNAEKKPPRRVRVLEEMLRELLALERLRIESRERLELASMKEARAADERKGRWYDALAQVLPSYLAELATMLDRGAAAFVPSGVRPVPSTSPAPVVSTESPPEADAPVERADAVSEASDEAAASPAPPTSPPAAGAPAANGVHPPHPLAHLYGPSAGHVGAEH